MSKTSKINKETLSEVLPPIRCKAEEKVIILEKAASVKLSLSEYVRQMSLEGKIVVRQSDVDFLTVQELKRIGVNINQQTKKFNATGEAPDELQSL